MLRLYFNRHLFVLLALGFSSGVPFLLILSTLSFWLSESHLSKSLLGLLMITSLPYSLKFLFAPFIETLVIPFLTRKLGPYKSWGLLSQIALVASIIALGHCHPAQNLLLCAVLSLFISFFSAIQDIVIDSYRLSLLSLSKGSKDLLGPGAAMESIGFRLGMLMSGAGTLYLAAIFDWATAYTFTAMTVGIGMAAFITITPPQTSNNRTISNLPKNNLQGLNQCWKTLFNQPYFWSLVGFIMCFKIADTVLNSMSAPFLFELGFTKIEYAQISKFFGISLMVVGGLTGGAVIQYLGLQQTVILCALVQTVSCLMFVVQGWAGHDMNILMITIGVESLCSGLTSTAFIAYLSHFCKGDFNVTQFLLLYSLGSFSRVVISALSGAFADIFGWTSLFFLASSACIPSVYYLMKVYKKKSKILPKFQTL
ncbi:MFS transporter [Candidatus Finniella inopinata]|uniref:MFS transporter n=1 Tax=Candidatus Finniella inopinata TaxID=1696036 RepID=A0A4Q7DKV8_9PROT|nr:MFS transporter [Candidatus Finniella inopinata]RZI47030.1 MFS transporter [Candidatus Finniella inopinata]